MGTIYACIVAHCFINSSSIFNVENQLSLYIVPIFLVVVPLAYAIYINKTIKE